MRFQQNLNNVSSTHPKGTSRVEVGGKERLWVLISNGWFSSTVLA